MDDLDIAETGLVSLPRERLEREALRAYRALQRYGKHDDDCPMHPDHEEFGTTCDCGLDAACFSPFVEEPDGYVLTMGPGCYLAHTQMYANGTTVLTIKPTDREEG